jgi:hypothetical protein
MKKLVPLFLAMMLLFVAVTPALAETEAPGLARRPLGVPFALVGKVTAVDTTAGTLTVNVLRASRPLKDKIGQDVVIKVTDETRLRHFGDPRGQFITLADVKVDQMVSINGRILKGDLIAWHVTTDVPFPHPQSESE